MLADPGRNWNPGPFVMNGELVQIINNLWNQWLSRILCTHWKCTLSTMNLVSNIPDVNTRHRSTSCNKQYKRNCEPTEYMLSFVTSIIPTKTDWDIPMLKRCVFHLVCITMPPTLLQEYQSCCARSGEGDHWIVSTHVPAHLERNFCL